MSPPNPFTACPSVTRVRDLAQRATAIVVGHSTDHATAERLSALGLGVGATLTVLQSGERPTVRVGESRIGLGPELACAVRVVERAAGERAAVDRGAASSPAGGLLARRE